MSYAVFQKIVDRFIAKAGNDLRVLFSEDTEHMRFFAMISDGTMIIGRKTSRKMTVRFGSGHCAMIAI